MAADQNNPECPISQFAQNQKEQLAENQTVVSLMNAACCSVATQPWGEIAIFRFIIYTHIPRQPLPSPSAPQLSTSVLKIFGPLCGRPDPPSPNFERVVQFPPKNGEFQLKNSNFSDVSYIYQDVCTFDRNRQPASPVRKWYDCTTQIMHGQSN